MAVAKICFLLHLPLPADKLQLLTVPRERIVVRIHEFPKNAWKKCVSASLVVTL